MVKALSFQHCGLGCHTCILVGFIIGQVLSLMLYLLFKVLVFSGSCASYSTEKPEHRTDMHKHVK